MDNGLFKYFCDLWKIYTHLYKSHVRMIRISFTDSSPHASIRKFIHLYVSFVRIVQAMTNCSELSISILYRLPQWTSWHVAVSTADKITNHLFSWSSWRALLIRTINRLLLMNRLISRQATKTNVNSHDRFPIIPALFLSAGIEAARKSKAQNSVHKRQSV